MRERRFDSGALIFGAILVIVGGYFLLREAGIDLPEIDWDLIWPFAIIALGVAVIWGARGRRSSG